MVSALSGETRATVPDHTKRAAIVQVDLDRPLRPLDVDPGHDCAFVVALFRGQVVGEMVAPVVSGKVPVAAQQRAIGPALHERVSRRRAAEAFTHATREPRPASPAPAPAPAISLVLSTSGQPDAERESLESVAQLRTEPSEVIVIDASSGLSAARNRAVRDAKGELIAFADDESILHPAWLDGLAEAFFDPLTMAVLGYVGPVELATPAQWRVQSRLSAANGFDPAVYDGFDSARWRFGDHGNPIVRRKVFEDVGLFAEDIGEADLFRRLLIGGYRIAFDPGRICWRQHRRSRRAQRALIRRIGRHGPAALPPAPRETSARVVESADPPLSVTIASYNRRERLAEVLEALGDQSYPSDRYDVVLVLDGSTDGSAEMARGLDIPYRMRVLEQDNRGLAVSRNRGGREATAEIVVWLDDDVVPEKGFLAEHAAAHRRAGEDHVALGAYPPDLGSDMDLIALAMRRWWIDHFRRKEEPDHQWTFVDFADGNFSTRASLVFEAGGWDESFPYGRRQDWEFGIRLLQRGTRFAYYPQARGLHRFDAQFESALRNRRIEGHNDVLLAEKHPQVRRFLYLSSIAETVALGGLSATFARFAYRRPNASRLLARAVTPIRGSAEKLNARRTWWSLTGRMLSHAYLLGARDALGSRVDLDKVVAMQREAPVMTLPVRLDEEACLQLTGPGGAMELALAYGETELGRVPATGYEEQWDWLALTERAVQEVWPALSRLVDPIEA